MALHKSKIVLDGLKQLSDCIFMIVTKVLHIIMRDVYKQLYYNIITFMYWERA